MASFINWKSGFIFIALLIVAASLYYTNNLANDLAQEERKKVSILAKSFELLAKSSDNDAISFALSNIDSNKTIPVILTDEKNTIIDSKNIDHKAKQDSSLLNQKLLAFRQQHPKVVVDFGFGKNYIYYGESEHLKKLRQFPYIQLCIIFLFLSVVLIALSAAHSANQNQLWISLSKETAHQLGTPISSLEAWTVLLEQHNTPPELLQELQKDVHRLQLVADRFSKIGSTPKLEVHDLSQLVARIKDYMQVRAPKHVRIDCIANETPISIPMSATLIEWVIENLLRNALDAMTHKGVILISLQKEDKQVVIDISDTGKGMSKAQAKQIFKPGYSTKKRGWGLGLSLSKRIVEQYHKGSLQLRQTELGKGATFRIILPL